MLPAPRDPHSPEAVPPDPPPVPPPDPPLASQLTGLLRSAGAQAVHAVDGGRGDVLVEVGLADGDDVLALVHLARAAKALGRGRGEWVEDLVVTLGRTVHVLRECDGVVLHARLDPSRGDVAAVRRGLAADGVVRAAAAAGRAAAPAAAPRDTGPRDTGPRDTGPRDAAPPDTAEPSGAGARPGRPGPVRGGAPRPAAGPSGPPSGPPSGLRPSPARHGRDDRPHPGDGNVWPYSLPEPSSAASGPNRRPTRPAGGQPAAAARELVAAGPEEPAHAALSTAPAMRRVAAQHRPAPPRPLGSMPGPGRPHPVPQQVSQPIPRPISQPISQPTSQPVPQPVPRPSPQPRPERLHEPPAPVPLPRRPARSGPDGRDPALVAVDVGPPVTASGALAVLALPPVAALPRRRPASRARPAPAPRAIVTPPVLRQPWASDVDTMQRLLARLHRMS